jgi:hypothetical protein
MDERAEIAKIAAKLLEMDPHPVARFRLFRDVWEPPIGKEQISAAKKAMLSSRWVLELEAAQEPNGIWGRFHSQDSSIRKPFRTSELAIRRALALGLDKDDTILKLAIAYMERVLQGKASWTDPPERHEGWPMNMRFINAGTLAWVDAGHPLLQPCLSVWMEILERTFASGIYHAKAEQEAQRVLNGIVTPGKYLHLGMLYPLLILTSANASLPRALENTFLTWLWQREEGLYYITPYRLSDMPEIGTPRFCGWLTALEVIARFPGWRKVAADAVDHLLSMRGRDGLWDVGSSARSDITFPFSSSWFNPINRKIDGTVRILTLLKKFYA